MLLLVELVVTAARISTFTGLVNVELFVGATIDTDMSARAISGTNSNEEVTNERNQPVFITVILVKTTISGPACHSAVMTDLVKLNACAFRGTIGALFSANSLRLTRFSDIFVY